MYTEVVVPQKNSPMFKVLKFISGVLTVTYLIFCLFGMFSALIGVIVFALSFWLTSQYVDIEYQYIYVDGSLEIDKIISNSKRKHIASVKMSQILLIAPLNSSALNNYKTTSTIDASARDVHRPPAVMVCHIKDTHKKFLLQINDALLKILKMQLGSKLLVSEVS